MTNKPENPPAFPCNADAYACGAVTAGMTLRDYFAGQADVPWNAVIETYRENKQVGCNPPTVEAILNYRAELKYIEADAMLRAREGK